MAANFASPTPTPRSSSPPPHLSGVGYKESTEIFYALNEENAEDLAAALNGAPGNEIVTRGGLGEIPLLEALRRNLSMNIVELLLDETTAQMVDKNGTGPVAKALETIWWSAGELQKERLLFQKLSKLTETGANANEADYQGRTPMDLLLKGSERPSCPSDLLKRCLVWLHDHGGRPSVFLPPRSEAATELVEAAREHLQARLSLEILRQAGAKDELLDRVGAFLQ